MQTIDESHFEERDGRHISACSPWRTPNVSHYFGFGQAFESFMLNPHMNSVMTTYLVMTLVMGPVDPAWFLSMKMVLVSTLGLSCDHSVTRESLASRLPSSSSLATCCGIDVLEWGPTTAALSDCPGGRQALAVPWHGCPQVCPHEIVVYIFRPRVQQSRFWVHEIQWPFQLRCFCGSLIFH